MRIIQPDGQETSSTGSIGQSGALWIPGEFASTTHGGLTAHFIQQSFCLPDHWRMEAFGKPAVNLREQSLRFSVAPLRLEPSREGCRRLQLVVLGTLAASAPNRGSIGCADRRSVGGASAEEVRVQQEGRRPEVSELFCLSDGLSSQCESIIKPPLTGQEFGFIQPFPSPEREQTDLLVKGGNCFPPLTYSLFGLPWIVVTPGSCPGSLTPLQTGCLATISSNNYASVCDRQLAHHGAA